MYKGLIGDLANSVLLHEFYYYGRHCEADYMQKYQKAFQDENMVLVTEYETLFAGIDEQIIMKDGVAKPYPYYFLTDRYISL